MHLFLGVIFSFRGVEPYITLLEVKKSWRSLKKKKTASHLTNRSHGFVHGAFSMRKNSCLFHTLTRVFYWKGRRDSMRYGARREAMITPHMWVSSGGTRTPASDNPLELYGLERKWRHSFSSKKWPMIVFS